MRQLETVDEVIAALGGLKAVRALLQLKTPQAVSNFKVRGGFPPRHYLVMKQALDAKGYTAPTRLWGLTAASAAA